MSKTFDERIATLEKGQTAPGTSFSRVLGAPGMRWVLGIGALHMPKAFFYGDSLEECVNQAETEMKRLGKLEPGYR